MRALVQLLSCCVLLLMAAAGAWAADEAPRGPDGLLKVPPLARVTDLAGVLSAADRTALDAKLAGFETSHGSQLAVVVVPSTQPEPIEDFAHRVGDDWKIGRKGVGDGVLVIVAVADKRVRIDVARALEGAIPDAIARGVIRDAMAPHFAGNDYAGGLNAGLDALFARIQGEALPAPEAPQAPSSIRAPGADPLQLILPFVIAGFVLSGVLRRVLGLPGALVGGVGVGVVAGWMLSSLALGAVVAVIAFVFSLFGGLPLAAQVLGGRGGFIPGGFGGGRGGGGGGGFSSGGGGDFSGGGSSGGW